ncbi:hypothetical protein IW261DRAFT_1425504 [Armillaria novae-zelandiae]|uniref:Uncharacterized protein n=1 Tax=Armillaria novae-zelandiae TaxID=153914 RepID=A0AA39U5C6_9AGAR|nr:hypothetical protein IW261DRAFT_1425504 [Armillaria novae-zelandiae]
MFSSKLALVFFSLASFVAANPAPIITRAPASVMDVLNNLKTTTDTVLPQIGRNNLFLISILIPTHDSDALVGNKTATVASVTPLLNQVISAVDGATSSVFSLQVQGVISKRDVKSDVAALAASIMNDINKTTQGLGSSGCGCIGGGLLGVVGATLFKLLVTLELVVPGLLAVVALLLKGVVGTVITLLCGLLGVVIGK